MSGAAENLLELDYRRAAADHHHFQRLRRQRLRDRRGIRAREPRARPLDSRGRKVAAQDRTIRRCRRGRRLLGRELHLGPGRATPPRGEHADPDVTGLRTASVQTGPGANREGAYWHYEMGRSARRSRGWLDHRWERLKLRVKRRTSSRSGPSLGPRPLVSLPDRAAGPTRRPYEPAAHAFEKPTAWNDTVLCARSACSSTAGG